VFFVGVGRFQSGRFQGGRFLGGLAASIKETAMRDTPKLRDNPNKTLACMLGVCALAIMAASQAQPASAQNPRATKVAATSGESPSATGEATATPTRSKLAGRYFVDFRARTAATYGHAFVWYGRLTDRGKVGKIEVAGLHPASDSPIPYILGHIIPVPSETGKSYGDLDEQYLTANYRVYLSEADAKAVFAYIQQKQANSPLWWNGVYNCTRFVADIAEFMGLKAPATSTWMYPETFINSLKEVNGGRHEVALAASTRSSALGDNIHH
jgi:hypothetical protein